MRVNFAQECRNEATESIYIYIDNLYVYVYSSYLIKSVLNLQIQKHLISDENKGYKRNSINTLDQQGKKHDLGCCNAAKVSFSQAQTGYCKFVVT